MRSIIFKFVFSAALIAGTVSVASAQTTRDFFDKQGKHLYSIAYYGEKGLPASVLTLVKPVYYDYTILTVEEVRVGGKSIYLIDMENDRRLKTLRVADGEMEEVSDLRRAD